MRLGVLQIPSNRVTGLGLNSGNLGLGGQLSGVSHGSVTGDQTTNGSHNVEASRTSFNSQGGLELSNSEIGHGNGGVNLDLVVSIVHIDIGSTIGAFNSALTTALAAVRLILTVVL